MDYYDGNTVTAEWNYAQHFAMSDNNFGSTFGPSTPGALNSSRATPAASTPTTWRSSVLTDGDVVDYSNPDSTGNRPDYSVIGDAQPYWDDCSTGAGAGPDRREHRRPAEQPRTSAGAGSRVASRPTSAYTGTASTASNYNQLTEPDRGRPAPRRATSARARWAGRPARTYGTDANYSAHYDAFQFYASTANPHHLAPDLARRRRHRHRDAGRVQHRQPQLRRLRVQRSRRVDPERNAPGKPLPGGELPEGAGLRDRAPGDLGPDRRAELAGQRDQLDRVSSRPGRARRSSSPTTTPTAGTTTCSTAASPNPSDTTADALDRRPACGTVPAAGQPRRHGSARQRAGSLRLRPPAAADRDLALRQAELRQHTISPTSPRSSPSSSRTGTSVRSPARSRTSLARSTTCSTSRRRPRQLAKPLHARPADG